MWEYILKVWSLLPPKTAQCTEYGLFCTVLFLTDWILEAFSLSSLGSMLSFHSQVMKGNVRGPQVLHPARGSGLRPLHRLFGHLGFWPLLSQTEVQRRTLSMTFISL